VNASPVVFCEDVRLPNAVAFSSSPSESEPSYSCLEIMGAGMCSLEEDRTWSSDSEDDSSYSSCELPVPLCACCNDGWVGWRRRRRRVWGS
jgi:hypothetical protein